MLDSYATDEGIQKVLQELQLDPQSHKNFTLSQGQLKRKGRIVVGKDENVQKKILDLFHTSGLRGHSGIHATYQRISSILYWRGLWKLVREFVRTYSICQQNKGETVASPGCYSPCLNLSPYFQM